MPKGLGGGGGGNSMGGRMGAGAGMSSMGPDRGRGNFEPMMQSPRPDFGGLGMPQRGGMPPQFLDMMFSMLPDSVRAKIPFMSPSGTPGPTPAQPPVPSYQPKLGPAPGSAQMIQGGGQEDLHQRLRALFGNRG